VGEIEAAGNLFCYEPHGRRLGQLGTIHYRQFLMVYFMKFVDEMKYNHHKVLRRDSYGQNG